MKKCLAALLAFMLVMSASVTAFGATVSDAKAVISASSDFALDGFYGADGYDVTETKYFLMYLKADKDAAPYEEAWLSSVKGALDSGNLTGIGDLGSVLLVMKLLGVDAKSFEGYNLVELFTKTDPNDCSGNPYGYMYATEAAAAYGLDEYGRALADAFVSSYYILGAGTDFWSGFGTSVDDLGIFVVALAPYAADYAEYIDDALALMEASNTADGYTNYGTANTDSTAYALAAYSALGNQEMADAAYDELMLFYNADGHFTAEYDEYYATADALFALEYYLDIDANGGNNTRLYLVFAFAAIAIFSAVVAVVHKKGKK